MTTLPRRVPKEIGAALRRLGLLDSSSEPTGAPVTGGVSSDVWRVDLPSGPVCAKRALPRLRVDADWRVPVERARWEARWLALAETLVPGAACPLIGFDEPAGVVVLRWLDPNEYVVWKASLLAGEVDSTVARALGCRLGRFHADAARLGLESWEEARPLFDALRIDPYFRTTARRHADLAGPLGRYAAELSVAAMTVIHGDVSPKNVLVGPDGPVLLDAECASPGDPAFDVAFCANHLMLKAVHLPDCAGALVAAADEFVAAYCTQVDWEESADLARRAARLLPALALARVDGASPVEYLTDQTGRPVVRSAAADLLIRPPESFAELSDRWASQIARRRAQP